jgi:acetyl esterase/lipase
LSWQLVATGWFWGSATRLRSISERITPARLTPAELCDIDTTVRSALGWYSPVDLAACYAHYENATLTTKMPGCPDWNAPPPPLMRRLLGDDAERLALQKGPGSGRLDWILGGSPAEVPDRCALLSPIAHVHSACPPTLLLQGRDDIIVPPEPALDLQEKLRSVGVAAAVLMLPQADHGFDLLATDWSPAARMALWHAERFLAWIAAGSGGAGARRTVAVRPGTPTPVT